MNRATTKGFKRLRQSAWCCGRNYQRWRFIGAAVQTTLRKCEICGAPLNFRLVANPSLESYRRRAIRNRLAGLTALGTERQRGVFPMPVEERNRRMLDRYAVRRDKFFARGLTSRGMGRIIRRGPTPLEKQWKALRAEVAMPVSADWDFIALAWSATPANPIL